MVKIGRFEIQAVSDGVFRLDGGAMFGVIPRVLWQRKALADEQNRISLLLGCLLVKTPKGRHILVDTGLSDKYNTDTKFLKIYGVERRQTLFDDLKRIGLTPSDIDLVINTHLHFDHCGGNTLYQGNRAVCAFPKATYIVQRKEWEDALRANERTRASYRAENFEPIEKAGKLELLDGDAELEGGIKLLLTAGHTRGHQCVLVESDGQGAIFLGDLVPTQNHLAPAWIMGYDTFPLETLEKKKMLLNELCERHWMVIFQHEIHERIGFLKRVKDRYEYGAWS